MPRNVKKGVQNQSSGELQGAWLDGLEGVCSAKPSKVAKYLFALSDLLFRKEVTQKQMQMLVGGLVYRFRINGLPK